MSDSNNGNTTDLAVAEDIVTEVVTPQSAITYHQRLNQMDVDRAVDTILTGVAAMERLKAMALRLTDDRHWDNMGGKPRLNAFGAADLATKCHLRIETFGSRLVEESRHDDGTLAYFAYECRGRVTSPFGPPLDCQGRCDSDAPFHSTRGKGKDKRKIPASEVRRAFIAQQAQTLCVTRGVTKYLGLEKLEWNDVKAATSARGGRTDVDFNKGKEGKDKAAPPPEDPPEPAPETPRAMIYRIGMKELGASVEEIQQAAKAAKVPEDSKEWTMDDADKVLAKLEAMKGA